MSYKIICPYCFKEMEDDEVLFRSELVNHGEPDFLPDDYDDIKDFQARYRGADKEEILAKYRDWEFFTEVKDPEYEAFWSNYISTTEYNPSDDILGVKAYYRRVIDPGNTYHQRYLKEQEDGSYLIRDNQGMVAQIELKSGEKCYRRVCRHCHNPLPDNYGKYPVKFASIIGITGAGKTVYLSQLLKKMRNYVAKVGLTAIVTNAGVQAFVEKNKIAPNHPLPGSTPPERLQQPLFYELVRESGIQGRITETFVLYDVAGEVFKDETPELVKRFAPFIAHSDGAIVLIDPLQFEVITNASKDKNQLADPTAALNTIQHIFTQDNANDKCKIPFAICISKADQQEVQDVLSEDLRDLLLDDVKGIDKGDGFYQTTFNAGDYAPIGRGLTKFIKDNELVLAQMMQTNYASYAYFALTALGCDVKEGKQDNGETYRYPVGPILPKRVEEPLLWLLYKLGYIGKNASIPGEIICPNCGKQDNESIPEDERYIIERSGPFGLRKIERYVNRFCRACGFKWEHTEE